MKDRWIKCLSSSGTIRGVSIRATDLVAELASLQELSPHGSKALGEALIGGLLIGSFCKPGERVNLNVQADGVAKQALVDAHPDGTVRGYVIENPSYSSEVAVSQKAAVEKTPDAVQTFSTPSGEFVIDLSLSDQSSAIGPWGTGLLSVLRTKDLEKKQPYIGTVPLITGHLAKDLTFYWLQSEQVPSAVGFAVNLGDDGKITSAGGFMLQALPGASTEEIKEIEQQVQHLGNLAQEVAEDRDPMHLLSKIFQNTAFNILETTDLKWQCTCSWERIQRALYLIGAEELENILKEQGEAVLKCDFCCKEYRADGETLKKMIAQSRN